MAFLAASPASTRKPICTKMSTGMWTISIPVTAHRMHIGTTRMIASGSDHDSYCAASTRKTSTVASRNTRMAVLPCCCSR